VCDDSAEADPAAGRTPDHTLVLQVERGKMCNPPDLAYAPNRAKPIVATALKVSPLSRRDVRTEPEHSLLGSLPHAENFPPRKGSLI